MTSPLLQTNSLQPIIQSMTETMDEIAYAFYLAYGMTPEDEELSSLLDVEMYNIINSVSTTGEFEASHREVLNQYP